MSLLLQEAPFSDPTEALAASDGNLRLLALITALHLMPEHGLLCVEEPEHGLHPLVFGPLLDLIRERCAPDGTRQVVVATHSPDLIDAAEVSEVIVAERQADGSTSLRRLDSDDLGEWLQDFRLGELWRMRHLGGVPH
ncbi:MAG: AAA family ATPase [Armatimonadetes bacterium]|nr:AAA family ATPase [Armatimonadota bacterium]